MNYIFIIFCLIQIPSCTLAPSKVALNDDIKSIQIQQTPKLANDKQFKLYCFMLRYQMEVNAQYRFQIMQLFSNYTTYNCSEHLKHGTMSMYYMFIKQSGVRFFENKNIFYHFFMRNREIVLKFFLFVVMCALVMKFFVFSTRSHKQFHKFSSPKEVNV
jgi:hypothetical protein